MMCLEGLDEFVQIGRRILGADAVLALHLLGDLSFIETLRERFQDPRAHRVQSKHLTLVNIEDNPAVFIASSTNSRKNCVHVLAPFRMGDVLATVSSVAPRREAFVGMFVTPPTHNRFRLSSTRYGSTLCVTALSERSRFYPIRFEIPAGS
jgi:hypothetical protein